MPQVQDRRAHHGPSPVQLVVAIALLAASLPGSSIPIHAQSSRGSQTQSSTQPAGDPIAALADALSAACRQDHPAFATHLTAANASAFTALPEPQQTALLKRLILLDDPGRPLLTTAAGGGAEVRCEAAGLVADIHFGGAEVHENLAFVTAQIGQPGEEARSVRIGFVRETGDWKLLSVGLLLLDLPAMAKQWQEGDLQASENQTVDALAKLAEALVKYQQAFGKLPDALEQLGPAPDDGASPEHARLLPADLAAGSSGGYTFRYVINPSAAATAGDDSARDRAAGFALAATPIEYGKAGRRSFYLDSNGTLRGDDKHGAVATASDPQILAPQQ